MDDNGRGEGRAARGVKQPINYKAAGCKLDGFVRPSAVMSFGVQTARKLFPSKAYSRIATVGGVSGGTSADARNQSSPGIGGAGSGSRVLAKGSPADFERRLCSERAHGPSSFTASRRTKRTTSREKTWPPSRDSQPKCWLYEGKTMARVVASGVLLEVTCDEKTIP